MNQIFFMCLVTTNTHIMTENLNLQETINYITNLQHENEALKMKIEILEQKSNKPKMTIAEFETTLNKKIITDLFDTSIINGGHLNSPPHIYISLYGLHCLEAAKTYNDEKDRSLFLSNLSHTIIIINYVNKFKNNKQLLSAIYKIYSDIKSCHQQLDIYKDIPTTVPEAFEHFNIICDYLEIEHI